MAHHGPLFILQLVVIAVVMVATQTIMTCNAWSTTIATTTLPTIEKFKTISVLHSKQCYHRMGGSNLVWRRMTNEDEDCHLRPINDDYKDEEEEEDQTNDDKLQKMTPRRNFLQNSLFLTSATLMSGGILSYPPAAVAATTTKTVPISSTNAATNTIQQTTAPNLNCLLDLPPPPSPYHVRIYLCRHGQTENNRLRLVQGSRVDPPLNKNGKSMGRRIGLALSKLDIDGSSISTTTLLPKVGYHSLLTRAKETALTASQTVSRIRDDKKHIEKDNALLVQTYDTDVMDSFQDGSSSGGSIVLNPLSTLGEVDFGPTTEGKSVTEMKAGMMKTWGLWSLGNIDVRPDGGGENAREVLTRVSSALQTLSQTASQNGGSIFAVSHSTYLRMLLAAITDTSLAEAALFEQKNGCINVLDIDTRPGATVTLTSNCKLLGGPISNVEKDFKLELPKTSLVRMNEVRHLEGVNLV